MECSICYEQITDINITVTSCNHKFHTDCLIRSLSNNSNICPYCRTVITTTKKYSSKIPSGIYDYTEYLEQLRVNNISRDDIPESTKEWLRECEEAFEILEKTINEVKEREEERKATLKKTDINKYKLFYGKSKKK